MQKPYFPMQTYNLTQGWGSNSYSHKNNKALDINGKDTGIELAYAPYDLIVKRIYTADANEIWLESLNPVEYANGIIDYMTILMAHANTVDVKVGDKLKQGDAVYSEGTKGSATGNHIHLEVGRGKFTGSGWNNSTGSWAINNPVAPEEVLWLREDQEIKNTIYQGKNYMLKLDEQEEPIDPTPTIEIGSSVIITASYTKKKDSCFPCSRKHISDVATITNIYETSKFPYELSIDNKVIGYAKLTSITLS